MSPAPVCFHLVSGERRQVWLCLPLPDAAPCLCPHPFTLTNPATCLLSSDCLLPRGHQPPLLPICSPPRGSQDLGSCPKSFACPMRPSCPLVLDHFLSTRLPSPPPFLSLPESSNATGTLGIRNGVATRSFKGPDFQMLNFPRSDLPGRLLGLGSCGLCQWTFPSGPSQVILPHTALSSGVTPRGQV